MKRYCNDCKRPRTHTNERRCQECRKRSVGKRLLNSEQGIILCLCGCGRRAEAVYLSDPCYGKHIQRKARGQWPSLINACPLWYGKGILMSETRTIPRPMPYHGPELADVVPDALLHDELIAAIDQSRHVALVSEGMKA